MIVEPRSQIGARMTNTRFANVWVEQGTDWTQDYSSPCELENVAFRIGLNSVPTDCSDPANRRVSASTERTKFRNAWVKAIPLAI